MHTLYDVTMPVFARGLGNLKNWLAKAERHAERSGIPSVDLLQARLAPDMFTFTQQVQYAYFTSLEAAENLSGRAQPEMSYSEESCSQLQESIDRAVRHLDSIGPSDLADTGSRDVETFLLPGRKMDRWTYVNDFALPNFYFHTVTAYAILRHLGVALGKGDYLGENPA